MAASPAYLAACEYVDRGLSVIPVGRDKKPLVAWEQFQHRRATDEELAEWFERWPEANVAIITGHISGLVVVDADGEQGMNWLATNMPVTGVYARTGKGVHGYFRLNGQEVRNRARLAPEVDVRGEGGYVVAPPSTHASGRPYEFVFPDGMNGWDGLADFDFPASQPSLASGGRGNLSGLSLEAVKPCVSLAPAAQGQRNATLARLAGRWAQKGLDSDEVLLLAKAWNAANNPPLGASELERTVRSICETHLRNHGAPEVVEARTVRVNPAPRSRLSFNPDLILTPPGIVSEIADWITATAIRKQPLFSLAAAISAACAALGQLYETPTQLRANIYFIGVGPTGCGKDHPRKCVKNLLSAAGLGERIGGEKIASGQGLLSRAAQQPCSIFQLDEFGLFMQSLANPNTGSHIKEIVVHFMELFSCANTIYHGTEYADQERRRRQDIEYPCVILNATTTPETFFKAMQSEHVVSGYLNRMLVVETGNLRPDCDLSPKDKAIPAHLVEWCKTVAAVRPGIGGNLAGVLPGNPHTVRQTPGAAVMLEQYSRDIDAEINRMLVEEDDGERLECLWNRAWEHASKLTLPIALGVNPNEPLVDEAIAGWCINFVTACTTKLVENVRARVASSENQARLKECLAAITSAGPRGLTVRDINRHKSFTKLHSREREEVLKSLQIAEHIAYVRVPTKTKARDAWVAVSNLSNLAESDEIRQESATDLSQ